MDKVSVYAMNNWVTGIGVPGGGAGGALAPPLQKYVAWQNRNGQLGRKEIDSLAEKNWKA